MVDIHTLNTVYRIERRSPLLAEVEDKKIYTTIMDGLISPMQDDLSKHIELGGDVDDTSNDILIKSRRTLMELKYTRAYKISTNALSHVRFGEWCEDKAKGDVSKLLQDPKGDELALYKALCDAFSKYLHGHK